MSEPSTNTLPRVDHARPPGLTINPTRAALLASYNALATGQPPSPMESTSRGVQAPFKSFTQVGIASSGNQDGRRRIQLPATSRTTARKASYHHVAMSKASRRSGAQASMVGMDRHGGVGLGCVLSLCLGCSTHPHHRLMRSRRGGWSSYRTGRQVGSPTHPLNH